MIHNANHLRPKRDGLKVGGHQASCASMVTLMTALYFDVLRLFDRVAVKPHGSPVFHAIQYLLGNQTRDQLERFRGFGGAQSYPSRTKDRDDVDISTGSVGMGVAMTSFAALAQEYLRKRQLIPDDRPPGRMIALAGDAEFDEGNIFEALLEAWKHQVTNVWWIIDYNRQSLDAIVADRFFNRLDTVFKTMEWPVVTLKYGKRLERAFARRGGDALRKWIDDCPNSEYSALAYQGGAAWRYDPFISRGLDALNYACYQDARFILVATPSGVSLAPEGGAHQSIITPLIGIGQPGLTAFEPAYVDEMAEILRWSFEHIQAEAGGSVYLRLSTRPLDQPKRELTADLRTAIVEGGYWLVPPAPGAELAIVACGPVVAEALEAHGQIVEDIPGAGLLVVTSAARLQKGWIAGLQDGDTEGRSHAVQLLQPLAPGAGLVTVLDGHPATLSWLGSVNQHRVIPLGVDRFGQSGDLLDLYRAYGLDVNAILNAAARLSVDSNA